MNEALQLPDFVINENTSDDDVKKLIALVKPAWDLNQIQIKPLSGGFSCRMYHCYVHENAEDGLTIRIRKLTADSAVSNSVMETAAVQVMAEKGLFAKVYAVFKNGYCYQYVVGKPLLVMADPPKAHFDDDILRSIADQLAKIHCVKVEGRDYTKSEFFDKIQTLYDGLYPDDPTKGIPSKEDVGKALNEMKDYFNKLPTRTILCHGDPHPGNMLWNEKNKTLTLVDWESCHVGSQSYDIGYFLQAMYFGDMLPLDPAPPKLMNAELELKFTRFYLQSWHKLNGNADVTEEDIQQFYIQVKFFRLVWHLLFTIGLGCFLDQGEWSKLGMSGADLANLLFNTYKSKRDELLKDIK